MDGLHVVSSGKCTNQVWVWFVRVNDKIYMYRCVEGEKSEKDCYLLLIFYFKDSVALKFFNGKKKKKQTN